MAEQKLTYKELQAEFEKAQAEIKRLEEYNEHIAQQNKEFTDLLLRARAQLQLFKDASKNNYLLTLNLKEI